MMIHRKKLATGSVPAAIAALALLALCSTMSPAESKFTQWTTEAIAQHLYGTSIPTTELQEFPNGAQHLREYYNEFGR